MKIRRRSGSDLATRLAMARPVRLSREQYLAPQICFVTFCARDRRPTLAAPAIVDVVVDAFSDVCDANAVAVLAYCVRPDHVHLLLGSETASADMRAIIERVKQQMGYRCARQFGLKLWQRSYFDHTLRAEEAVESIIAYIVNNPIRAGFVTRPENWPFWGSSHCSRAQLLDTISMSGAGCRPGY